MPFLDDHFLLTTDTARRLYHEVAAHQPIYDYHTHLDPGDIARNRVYENLTDIWLEGDHYKWRAMRACAIDEAYITGDADPYDKFLAWAKCVPQTLRNPLYHWTHLELRRYFGIDVLLSQDTAKQVWDEANAKLPGMDTWSLFDKMKVAMVGTTDDPTDDLSHHRAIADSALATVVTPTWRPDVLTKIFDPAIFNAYLEKLGVEGDGLQGLIDRLEGTHQAFHDAGCRLSDHGVASLPDVDFTLADVEAVYKKARSGQAPSTTETGQFVGWLFQFCGKLNADKGWTMQMHLGPIRNLNRKLFREVGPDLGCDSMCDEPQGAGLVRLFGELSEQGTLPKTVIYNLNPVNNDLFATMLGNFQDNTQGIKSKMQFGSGWWYNDQKQGMTAQLNALSNLGLLSHFVGMLTDSRSMLSYIRHEYFRRILCDLIGTDVENGELPDDPVMIDRLVADVCFNNANHYFGIKMDPRYG
ncbi:MAG: glucuronate isomerase [Planctomycetota bacterium]